jgi:hypothetical protein
MVSDLILAKEVGALAVVIGIDMHRELLWIVTLDESYKHQQGPSIGTGDERFIPNGIGTPCIPDGCHQWQFPEPSHPQIFSPRRAVTRTLARRYLPHMTHLRSGMVAGKKARARERRDRCLSELSVCHPTGNVIPRLTRATRT